MKSPGSQIYAGADLKWVKDQSHLCYRFLIWKHEPEKGSSGGKATITLVSINISNRLINTIDKSDQLPET